MKYGGDSLITDFTNLGYRWWLTLSIAFTNPVWKLRLKAIDFIDMDLSEGLRLQTLQTSYAHSQANDNCLPKNSVNASVGFNTLYSCIIFAIIYRKESNRIKPLWGVSI